MNYLQFFFTNKWHKGHYRITPNSGRALFFFMKRKVFFQVLPLNVWILLRVALKEEPKLLIK